MIVTTLNGQSEFLTDYNIKERKQVVNGEYTLPFIVIKTDRNKHSFDLVQEDSIVEYEGHKYRIKKIREYLQGKTPVKDIEQCQHTIFDMVEDFQYDILTGTLNFTQALNHLAAVTNITFINQGAFAPVDFDKFGDATAQELFKIILDRYGAEFEITGENEITLKNQIGQPRDAQFRFGHNVKTLYKDVDSTNVSTYIKGFGKGITSEYTSPNASIYGIRHATPVRDERFEVVENLQQHLQDVLIDTPSITIQVEIVELLKQGIPMHEYGLGDTIFLIMEELGIDATVRILEYTDFPETKGKSPVVILSNYKQSFTQVMTSFGQTTKTVKQLTDVDGNLSLALKRLYRNSNHYSDHTGDWYVSPEDPNAYVHIGAGGLDVHKGLVRVEREDGYAVIIGGVLQNSLSIQGSEPPFQTDAVQKIGQFYMTQSAGRFENVQRFTFKHDSRYVRVIANMYTLGYAQDGNVGNMAFDVVDDSETVSITSAVVTETGGPLSEGFQGYRKDILLDLGVPTGNIYIIYWRMWNSVVNWYTYGSVRYIVQEG